jgi:histone H3/H4
MARKKATKKKAARKSTKKKEVLVVGSKTKEALKGNGKFNVSSDALEALNEYVYLAVEQAQKRCAANGRKTIRPYDILAL